MQMHAMNQYGNRGFNGPPQPQRQGRRGNNRGSFRGNSRFEHNQNQPHRNGQGGQRPNEPRANPPTETPVTQPAAQQPIKPAQQPPQTQQQPPKPPQQQPPKPPQQQQQQQPPPPKPQQQQTTPNKPQQQQPIATQPAQQLKESPKVPQVQQKPVQSTPAKQDTQDNVDKAVTDEPKPLMGNLHLQKGGWAPGGGNKQAGFSNQGGSSGNFNNQGGGFNKQGGFNNQGGGFNNQGSGFNNQGSGFNNQNRNSFGGDQGNTPHGQKLGGPPRNQRGPRGPGGPGGDMKPAQREEHMLANKLKDLVGPLIDIPHIDQEEVKFNGRSRLYIGNLSNETTEEEIQNLFSQFGECAELFVNKEKNFGFIKMDFRVNAERAKRELDGKMRNGRSLRVRFAPHNCAVRIKNLPPFVSNELLYRSFEIFGRIERAYVRVDERGKPLGEGIVEYSRKPSALAAIRNCTEKCFFLTSSLRPVIVESFDEPDELDGYPEKNLPKKHPEYLKARELGPRFSEQGSFEHEYGTRWKQLHELHRQKEEALKKELSAEEEKLEAQMEYAKYEHETELLREQLRQREQDRERQKRSWELAERAADTRRDTDRAQLLRHEEELAQRMRHQDDELRRRQQENTLFVQAQRLSSMLDRQEQGMFDKQSPMDGGFREQFDMPRGSFEDMPQGRGWDGPRQMDDFPNKRRRY